MENKIILERETYEKNDKTYFSYFVKGTLRGKDVKVAMVPMDFGGYAALEIVFDKDMQAELCITPFEIKDATTGRIFKGNTYSARSVGEDGQVYECEVKPFRKSDKALLNMLNN